jgi:hypothetical protein
MLTGLTSAPERHQLMRLFPWRDFCPDTNTCPVLRRTDRGTAVLVGTTVTDPEALAQLNIAPSEVAIEIPLSLIMGLSDE